jgi:hypothetical protein
MANDYTGSNSKLGLIIAFRSLDGGSVLRRETGAINVQIKLAKRKPRRGLEGAYDGVSRPSATWGKMRKGHKDNAAPLVRVPASFFGRAEEKAPPKRG